MSSGDAYHGSARGSRRRRGTGHAEAWRVLKSHEGHRSFSRALGSGRAIAVYAFRDIRDVVCSLMHKRGATFRQLLRQGMIHQVLANDRYWRAQPGVLVQRYDEMVADPVTAVVQLARHLGLGVTRRQAVEIADEYSLESNLTRIEALRQQLEEAGIDLTAAGNLQIYDPVTLLHWNHVRPGGSGSWRHSTLRTRDARRWRGCAPLARGQRLQPRGRFRIGSDPRAVGRDGLGSRRTGPALGRAVALLRWAAGSCPPAARLTRQLLRIAQPALGANWPGPCPIPRASEPHGVFTPSADSPLDRRRTAVAASCPTH